MSSCVAGQPAEARWEERGGAAAGTHRLWGFDEHFTLPQLELVIVHVDRLQQMQNPLLLISSPHRPSGFGQDGVPMGARGQRGHA